MNRKFVLLAVLFLAGALGYRVFLDLRTHRIVDRASLVQERTSEEFNPPKVDDKSQEIFQSGSKKEDVAPKPHKKSK